MLVHTRLEHRAWNWSSALSGGTRRPRWDRLVPPRILLRALDGEARTWLPAELMEHSTLRHSDAWHDAYGGLATVHHAYALASHQFAIGAGCARGLPYEESDSNCDVPPGWVPRVTFFLGCGTNTSRAKRLVFAAAAVFMPVVVVLSAVVLSSCRWCPT
jgi:hypothetical protein